MQEPISHQLKPELCMFLYRSLHDFPTLGVQVFKWVVVKIRVPIIVRHLLFRGPKRVTIILTTTQIVGFPGPITIQSMEFGT